MNLIGKVLKCAGNDDVVTLKSEEGTDNLTLHFESPNQDRFVDILKITIIMIMIMIIIINIKINNIVTFLCKLVYPNSN